MELMLAVIERALVGSEKLQAAERADLFEGIAQLTLHQVPALSLEAAETAKALREAEARQLTFAALLRPNPTETETQNTRQQ